MRFLVENAGSMQKMHKTGNQRNTGQCKMKISGGIQHNTLVSDENLSSFATLLRSRWKCRSSQPMVMMALDHFVTWMIRLFLLDPYWGYEKILAMIFFDYLGRHINPSLCYGTTNSGVALWLFAKAQDSKAIHCLLEIVSQDSSKFTAIAQNPQSWLFTLLASCVAWCFFMEFLQRVHKQRVSVLRSTAHWTRWICWCNFNYFLLFFRFF